MTTSVVMYDKKLNNLIVNLGGEGIRKCYQCGSCTAICPVSETFSTSFRRAIKYAQLGLEKKLTSDLTPWVCYACGECSNSCPRDANPSALMMAFRRYLTIKYDWTGLSRLLYISKKVELLAILILSLLTGAIIYLFHGPIILDHVALETFAPINIVEPAGLTVLAILALILSGNIYRMYRFTVSNKTKLPLKTYFTEFVKVIPTSFLTQKVFNYCNDKKYWINHLLIFYGYALSFLLFAILLRFTQTDEPFLFVSILSALGIFAAVALLYGGFSMIYGRIKKSYPIFKVSHSTDWMFVVLLVLVTVTGLLTGIFRTLNYPLATYITYSVHLMLVVPFLVLEVPFLKWSHLAYRPFALYFKRLNELKGVNNA